MIGLVGKKLGMSQVFDQEGKMVPVTVLELGPNRVVQVKRADGPDGYDALKVGFGEARPGKITKPDLGVFRSAGVEPADVVREFRVDAATANQYSVGDELTASLFEPGSKIDVTAYSKGRGYQGVVKRHGFKGAKEKTHGTHEYKRHAGAIGCSAWPSRVVKGKKMPGQMGDKKVTVQALTVVGIQPDKNLLLVKGSVPGAPNGIVEARISRKQPEFL